MRLSGSTPAPSLAGGLIRVGIILLVGLVGGLATPRAALGATGIGADAGDPAGKVFPPLASPSLSHESQLGISVLPGSGFRVLFPFSEGIYCGQLGKRVCTGRLPTFLDVSPSYGVSAHWDLLFDLRLGLERDFAGTHQIAFVPGFRYWTEPGARAKFFATLQIAYDATAQRTSALSKNDFAVHNANGLMVDIMPNLGFYAQFGDTIGFIRWLRFEIDLGLGVQARFP
jgi:hypothetical protein